MKGMFRVRISDSKWNELAAFYVDTTGLQYIHDNSDDYSLMRKTEKILGLPETLPSWMYPADYEWKQNDESYAAIAKIDSSSRPSTSMWGHVDHCKKLIPGVYSVETERHGGIMVHKSVAPLVLSHKSIEAGVDENGFIQYEEDCDANIPLVEMYRKHLYHGFAWNQDHAKEMYEYAQDSIHRYNPEVLESLNKLYPKPEVEKSQAAELSGSKDKELRFTFSMNKLPDDVKNELKEHLSLNGYDVIWSEEDLKYADKFTADYEQKDYICTILDDRNIDYDYSLGLLPDGYDAAWLSEGEQFEAHIVTEEEFKRINEDREKNLIKTKSPYVKVNFTEGGSSSHKSAFMEKGTVLPLSDAEKLLDTLNEKFKSPLKADIELCFPDAGDNEPGSYEFRYDFESDNRYLEDGKKVPYKRPSLSDYLRMTCSYSEVLDKYESEWRKAFTPELPYGYSLELDKLFKDDGLMLKENYKALSEKLRNILDEHKKNTSGWIVDKKTYDSGNKAVIEVQNEIKKLFEDAITSLAEKASGILAENKNSLPEKSYEALKDYAVHSISVILQDAKYSESRTAEYGEHGYTFDFSLWRKSLELVPQANEYKKLISKSLIAEPEKLRTGNTGFEFIETPSKVDFSLGFNSDTIASVNMHYNTNKENVKELFVDSDLIKQIDVLDDGAVNAEIYYNKDLTTCAVTIHGSKNIDGTKNGFTVYINDEEYKTGVNGGIRSLIDKTAQNYISQENERIKHEFDEMPDFVRKDLSGMLSNRTQIWFTGQRKTIKYMLDYIIQQNGADFSLEKNSDGTLYIQGYDNGMKKRGKMNLNITEISYLRKNIKNTKWLNDINNYIEDEKKHYISLATPWSSASEIPETELNKKITEAEKTWDDVKLEVMKDEYSRRHPEIILSETSISLKQLYEFAENTYVTFYDNKVDLEDGNIIIRDAEGEHYDLKTKSGELICCDGETVISEGNNKFRNKESGLTFSLSEEEAAAAFKTYTVEELRTKDGVKTSDENRIPSVSLGNFDYDVFKKAYSENYDYFYNSNDEAARDQQRANMYRFEFLMKYNKNFKDAIARLVKERGDFFSSDREEAAALKTLREMGIDLSLDINELADAICQTSFERSASGFNYQLDYNDIALIAGKDEDWVKENLHDICSALAEHNDELLLDFNESNALSEDGLIDLNFCSIGEDANELFKKNDDGRWIRKTNLELLQEGFNLDWSPLVINSKDESNKPVYDREVEYLNLDDTAGTFFRKHTGTSPEGVPLFAVQNGNSSDFSGAETVSLNDMTDWLLKHSVSQEQSVGTEELTVEQLSEAFGAAGKDAEFNKIWNEVNSSRLFEGQDDEETRKKEEAVARLFEASVDDHGLLKLNEFIDNHEDIKVSDLGLSDSDYENLQEVLTTVYENIGIEVVSGNAVISENNSMQDIFEKELKEDENGKEILHLFEDGILPFNQDTVLQKLNERKVDSGVESIQTNGGMSEVAMEADAAAIENEEMKQKSISEEVPAGYEADDAGNVFPKQDPEVDRIISELKFKFDNPVTFVRADGKMITFAESPLTAEETEALYFKFTNLKKEDVPHILRFSVTDDGKTSIKLCKYDSSMEFTSPVSDMESWFTDRLLEDVKKQVRIAALSKPLLQEYVYKSLGLDLPKKNPERPFRRQESGNGRYYQNEKAARFRSGRLSRRPDLPKATVEVNNIEEMSVYGQLVQGKKYTLDDFDKIVRNSDLIAKADYKVLKLDFSILLSGNRCVKFRYDLGGGFKGIKDMLSYQSKILSERIYDGMDIKEKQEINERMSVIKEISSLYGISENREEVSANRSKGPAVSLRKNTTGTLYVLNIEKNFKSDWGLKNLLLENGFTFNGYTKCHERESEGCDIKSVIDALKTHGYEANDLTEREKKSAEAGMPDFDSLVNTAPNMFDNIRYICENYPVYKNNLSKIYADLVNHASLTEKENMKNLIKTCQSKEELNSFLINGCFRDDGRKPEPEKKILKEETITRS